ncbi:4Fe-4S binding protein [Clostridium aestuarii]|uniref:4Fe-4S binding protein n=1 Tax=Clostridium aestuarii TaxID=338193 RepID=A0ABT4D152_9CLOT|nr:4Fe-4S binding protein [Clostridium aestuarii]MCY6484968.1 4Fe-4S binding protein [Clostridium aestuarii]
MAKKRRKSHQKWSWIFMVMFILLSVIDIRFGLLGIVCISAPIYHAIRGRGKIHCSHYCPRGSILGTFLKHISLEYNIPKNLKSKTVKNILLGLMIIMFTIGLIHAGTNIKRIGFAIFRLMMSSLALGVIMGIIFKPRSWCQVCPMGYGTGIIDEKIKKQR